MGVGEWILEICCEGRITFACSSFTYFSFPILLTRPEYHELRNPGIRDRMKWRPKEEMGGNGRAREGEREREREKCCFCLQNDLKDLGKGG